MYFDPAHSLLLPDPPSLVILNLHDTGHIKLAFPLLEGLQCEKGNVYAAELGCGSAALQEE